MNELEPRLTDDLRQWLHQLAPPGAPYLHNDIHLRTDYMAVHHPEEEPPNTHAHLLAMLLGQSLTVPITEGELDLGRFQSVFLVELDGPRDRTLAVQVCGHD